MDQFSRIVLGYHGCDPDFAESLLRGEIAIQDWKPSKNDYDWLGHGIYFWEYAPERARSWSSNPGVVGALIQLGMCLDLTDVKYTALVEEQFLIAQDLYHKRGQKLPTNKGKRRDLDCFIINRLMASSELTSAPKFQTVRCPFLEGDPVLPGSGILRESHVQISVHDCACILGVFRPNLK